MTAPIAPTPADMPAPYRIAPDTWVIPELVAGPPDTVVPLNSMVIRGPEPIVVDTGARRVRVGLGSVGPVPVRPVGSTSVVMTKSPATVL